MILCNQCKGVGSTTPSTSFGQPGGCARCHGSGRLSFRDLRHGDHVCLLFKDPFSQLSDAVDFLMEGLHRGERLLYACDEHTADEIRIKFIEKGINAAREIERGALEIIAAKDIYVSGGDFIPEKVVQFFKGYIEATVRAGFTGLRVAAESSWALKNPDWLSRLGEYEALVGEYIRNENPPALGLCQFNRNRFNPEAIRMALDTHGAAILS